ncbi:MAG: SPFH domain-containing protein, partial [Victivallales bacterium]|nr:SPFH domain-containing protein [Victivallales bacterium]
MGILKNIFGSQFIDIIQWDNETPGVLVHRFDRQNHEIKWHAKLIVRPGQSAVFVSEGKIADRFGPGTYTLDTKNIPILRNLLSLPYGFESPFKAEVYFIKETEQLGRKWGTANPVLLRDTDFGKVRLRAHGLFSYKIGIRDEMISRFVGSRPEFTAEELETQVKPTIVSSFTDTLGEMHIPALDLAANYDEIGQHMMGKLTPEFANYGLELLAFKLENISLPEEVNKAIDERSTVGALQDASDDYSKIQAAKAMREAANNPGGAGNMMGLLMGAHLGQMAQQPVAYQQPQAA